GVDDERHVVVRADDVVAAVVGRPGEGRVLAFQVQLAAGEGGGRRGEGLAVVEDARDVDADLDPHPLGRLAQVVAGEVGGDLRADDLVERLLGDQRHRGGGHPPPLGCGGGGGG